jgi:hypothetical protein
MEIQTSGNIDNLSNTSSTVLFFSINSMEELEEVRTLLRKKKKAGKQLMAFVFYPEYHNLDVVTDQMIFLFNLNDFTLFAEMKDSLRIKMQEVCYELLISFVQSPNPFCLQIISMINAGFKVGVFQSGQVSICNLTLKTDVAKIGIEEFYEQVFNYLGVLNIGGKE